jgi:hypothetical protein
MEETSLKIRNSRASPGQTTGQTAITLFSTKLLLTSPETMSSQYFLASPLATICDWDF